MIFSRLTMADCKRFGGALHFLEDAVDSEPDTEFFVERLEMNIARAGAMRFDDQHRHHANDRGIGFIAFGDGSAVAELEAKIDTFANFSLRASAASSAVP